MNGTAAQRDRIGDRFAALAQIIKYVHQLLGCPNFHAQPILAFLDVDLYLNETRIFLLRGVRIVKQNDGSVYCQLPHQKSERDARYYPIVCCYDQKLKQQIQNAALAAYHEAVSDPVIQLAMNLQEVQA